MRTHTSSHVDGVREVAAPIRGLTAFPPGAAVALRGSLMKTQGRFGFNEWWYRTDIESGKMPPADKLAAMAKKAGSNVARIPVPWGAFEKAPGQYDFGELDRVVKALEAKGIKPLLVPVGTPDWAATEGSPKARYPNAAAIEVWNEPNLSDYGSIPPAEYAKMLTMANAEIRQRNSGMKVVSAGISPKAGWQDYMRTMLREAKGDYEVAIHPYGRGSKPVEKTVDIFESADKLTNRKLWATELGFSTGDMGPKQQGKALAKAYELLKKEGAAAIIAHRLIDDPGYKPGDDWEQGLGVVGSDGERKPAFRMLRHAVRG
jgi:hypothetical protein